MKLPYPYLVEGDSGQVIVRVADGARSRLARGIYWLSLAGVVLAAPLAMMRDREYATITVSVAGLVFGVLGTSVARARGEEVVDRLVRDRLTVGTEEATGYRSMATAWLRADGESWPVDAVRVLGLHRFIEAWRDSEGNVTSERKRGQVWLRLPEVLLRLPPCSPSRAERIRDELLDALDDVAHREGAPPRVERSVLSVVTFGALALQLAMGASLISFGAAEHRGIQFGSSLLLAAALLVVQRLVLAVVRRVARLPA